MSRLISVNTTNGVETVEVIDRGFQATTEPWCEFLLDDGTVIRLRLVVSQIMEVVNGVPDPATGAPQYVIKSDNIMAVIPAPQK